MARGNPGPNIEWLDQDNNPVTTIPKVRHLLSNGSLYFPSFDAETFRQDVHWTIYKCIATNNFGTIISRDLHLKAVVNQRYEPEVQNPGGFIGSNVFIKCNIPSFVKDYVTVTSWLQEPALNIYPSMESGEFLLTILEVMVWFLCRFFFVCWISTFCVPQNLAVFCGAH